MRRAFSLVTAIFVMIIMASIAALVFNLSGKSVQATTLQYRQEQAALLAKSYTELAVMAILRHDRDTLRNCIEDIDGIVKTVKIAGTPSASATSANGGGYDVRTRIYYIGNNMNNCSASRWLNSGSSITTNYNNITGSSHTDALAAVIIDVYVRYKDPNMYAAYLKTHGTPPSSNQIPWITYHRRTIQKI
jgi:type II secretory pathway pseudopilin PulG